MKIRFLLGLLVALVSLNHTVAQSNIANPLFEGFYAADPSIVKHNGFYYVYATIDPWGGEELAVFKTKDFVNYERLHINWPTKKQCTSSTSNSNKVWAPSVVKRGGKFYMYVSVGSEVWAGTSDSPSGPWRNLKADNTPLIKKDFIPGYHMIDAECFIDDDGQAYLYWGSGLRWVNGKCFIVKLKEDMYSFDGDYKEITPPNYFEGPVMMKRKNVYYLMYSEGKATNCTYKIRYSTSTTPYGPWTEGATSPILQSDENNQVCGPGHHTAFNSGGKYYILYHKIFPQTKSTVLRQLCLGDLDFDKKGNIKKVEYRPSFNLK